VDIEISDQEHADVLPVFIHLEQFKRMKEELVMKLVPVGMYMDYNAELVETTRCLPADEI
jgi:hypothetical protein